MADELAIINRLIEEHETTRRHIKLLGDSLSDAEALASLKSARADWIPGRPEIVAEKQKKLQRALSALDEGLGNHFAFEERTLPPLLGELFMRALLLDHEEIRGEIEQAKSLAAEIELEGLKREELMARESHIQGVIDGLRTLIAEHMTTEEALLEMLQKALQEKQRRQNDEAS